MATHLDAAALRTRLELRRFSFGPAVDDELLHVHHASLRGLGGWADYLSNLGPCGTTPPTDNPHILGTYKPFAATVCHHERVYARSFDEASAYQRGSNNSPLLRHRQRPDQLDRLGLSSRKIFARYIG